MGVMHYDSAQRWLVTGGTTVKAWPLKSMVAVGKDAHSSHVSCVLYNPNFNEVCDGFTTAYNLNHHLLIPASKQLILPHWVYEGNAQCSHSVRIPCNDHQVYCELQR